MTTRTPTMPDRTELDVRPIPPKDRYDAIMGAYEALPVGGTLHLTVDHDPTCMYYTLKATRGDEAFRFEYLEQGPEVWRVVVAKRLESE
ncbi:MAG TPA: DUF2249 domain-containing protein [Longimicrobiales bacterium]